MNVAYTCRFDDEFDDPPTERQEAASNAIQDFLAYLDKKRPLNQGLGLKPYHGSSYWEIRSSLAERILFEWEKHGVVFRFVGSHDQLR